MKTQQKNEIGIDLGSFATVCFRGTSSIVAHPDSCYEVLTNDIGKKTFPFVLICIILWCRSKISVTERIINVANHVNQYVLVSGV